MGHMQKKQQMLPDGNVLLSKYFEMYKRPVRSNEYRYFIQRIKDWDECHLKLHYSR